MLTDSQLRFPCPLDLDSQFSCLVESLNLKAIQNSPSLERILPFYHLSVELT